MYCARLACNCVTVRRERAILQTPRRTPKRRVKAALRADRTMKNLILAEGKFGLGASQYDV
jgi:hypothetical protein